MEFGEMMDILSGNNIDHSTWFKTPQELHAELMSKDSELTSKGVSILTVGHCIIHRKVDNKQLLEKGVRYHDGREADRKLPVSGKLRVGEDPFIGMQREVMEELGLPFEAVRHMKLVSSENVMGGCRISYNTLPSEFLKYHFVLCLPDEYVRDTYTEDDDVKVTTFGWV